MTKFQVPPEGAAFRIIGNVSQRAIYSRLTGDPVFGAVLASAGPSKESYWSLIKGTGSKDGLFLFKNLVTGKVLYSRASAKPYVWHVDGGGRYFDNWFKLVSGTEENAGMARLVAPSTDTVLVSRANTDEIANHPYAGYKVYPDQWFKFEYEKVEQVSCTDMAPSKSQLAMLWPNPGPPLTTEAPVRWPGISPASTAALREYLQKDYEQHHGFFNNRGFHNHTPFHLLVEWVLGGTPAHLSAIWDQHVAIERPQFQSPHAITAETFNDHLGDENYYQAYLYFFSDVVLRKPAHVVLEEWIFSSRVNYDTLKDGMFNRLLAGVMHPLIYVGFGLEFSLPGLVAEGLAHAAVHKNSTSTLLPRYMFETPSVPRPMTMGAHSAGVHAFSILARIQREHRFNNVVPNFKFDDIHTQYGEDIQRYAAEWIVEGMDSKEVAEKVKELIFLNVMIYAMGGWSEEKGFRYAEFTLMHLVTSSITMSSYMASISTPASKTMLLRAYFSRSLAYWISRGRPILNIRSFFASSTVPTIPGPTPTPYSSAFPKPTALGALTPNPWLQIIQSALVHPDDHLGKFQRTLAYYGALYGAVTAGEFKGTELDGSDYVDGTLFLRAAGLTMEKMGRVREGEKDQYWTNDPNFPTSFASLR